MQMASGVVHTYFSEALNTHVHVDNKFRVFFGPIGIGFSGCCGYPAITLVCVCVCLCVGACVCVYVKYHTMVEKQLNK
jgi:hypothetical protein